MSSTTFKQYWLPEKKGFDSLKLRSVPKELPRLGQILVRIKAVSLNWRDGIVAIGTYLFPGPNALVPGSDGPGIVEAVGEGVTEWTVGDRVVANFTQEHIAGRLTRGVGLTQLGGEAQGLLGEYFIFPKTGVVKIPDYLSFEEASCLPCAALTAWNALYGLTPLRPGQTVLLQGTGGVATFALQIAHVAGAKTIVTSSSDDKLVKVKDLASFDAIGFNGQIHCIGHITNPDPLGAGKDLRGPDAAFLALDHLCVVRGVVVGSREQLQDMLDCFEANEIRPVIDRVFSFENAREAYDHLWSSTHTGKVVIRRRQAMDHYIRVLSELLTITLAKALIAYSSGHMSHSDPSYTTVSLAARSRALCELSATISRQDQTASVTETALSACLILLTSEVCLGSHQSWYNHLIGAKHLIACAQRQAGGSLVKGAQALRLTSEGRWILRNFAYHDIIGSVTLGTKPLLFPDYLRDTTHEFDSYLGVASQVLIYIGQITCLDLSTTYVEVGVHPSRNYLSVEHDVESWKCPAGTPSNFQAVAHAYRGAALIYLYRKMRRHLEADTNTFLACGTSLNTMNGKLHMAVDNTLDSIGHVPENDVSESSLIKWNLFERDYKRHITSENFVIFREH
ncbi:unnamed protein product [Fusarium fujikuroi]|uniref:Enoyl reductase (ER) domain-containing protein n=1 Tax=Fusarium fujikuroi TaxID=5127 RepID=A0A9Q9UAD0_FUSFU|nr:unnamed protein product [Fusarium fujikuroi]VTT72078.1 unnamed protein product [Fusarium fujikuroi]VZH87510.1 unnamed protein product [Fusarium fujikuroi]